MKTHLRPARLLRLGAVVFLLATAATWIATGRHLGWTQTSRVRLELDPVTGIEFPVREPAFTAGVEVLAAGAATAAALLAAAWLLQRRGPLLTRH